MSDKLRKVLFVSNRYLHTLWNRGGDTRRSDGGFLECRTGSCWCQRAWGAHGSQGCDVLWTRASWEVKRSSVSYKLVDTWGRLLFSVLLTFASLLLRFFSRWWFIAARSQDCQSGFCFAWTELSPLKEQWTDCVLHKVYLMQRTSSLLSIPLPANESLAEGSSAVLRWWSTCSFDVLLSVSAAKG